MKKKLIPLFLAPVCAMACAVGLAACGGGDGGDDNKTLLSLVIVDAEGNEHDTYEIGDIVYGGTPKLSSLKLYAKYSDNTKTLLQNSDGDLSVTYYYNEQTVAELPQDVGEYEIKYRYNNNLVASVNYEIVTSATATPFTLNVSTATLKYPQEATVTVTKGGAEVSKDDYQVFSLTSQEYDEIKNAANFKEQLEGKRAPYGGSFTAPGAHYLFAYIDNKYNSNFVTVTIEKGDVTPTALEGLYGSYSFRDYQGTTGKIPLSSVTINDSSVQFKNANGENVSGYLQWQNPNEGIDYSNNGTTRQIKWIPDERAAAYYNQYIIDEPIPLNIEKGYVETPYIDSYGYVSFKRAYDGELHVIKLYLNNENLNYFKKLVKVTRNSEENEAEIGADGGLGTIKNIGKERYKCELRDKVNYCWYGSEEPDGTDTSDRYLEYEITARQACVNIARQMINSDRKVIIELKQGPVKDSAGDYLQNAGNITPYEAGTLEVELLQTYQADAESEVLTTNVVGDLKVENTNGTDWIIFDVNAINKRPEGNHDSNYIILKFTAKGENYFADLDVVQEVYIAKNDGRNIKCPINTGNTINMIKGETVSDLYTDYYPDLETTLGKWVLYIEESENEWVKAEMDFAIPSESVRFKAKYVSDFVDLVFIDDVYFYAHT